MMRRSHLSFLLVPSFALRTYTTSATKVALGESPKPFHVFLDLDRTLLFRARPPIKHLLTPPPGTSLIPTTATTSTEPVFAENSHSTNTSTTEAGEQEEADVSLRSLVSDEDELAEFLLSSKKIEPGAGREEPLYAAGWDPDAAVKTEEESSRNAVDSKGGPGGKEAEGGGGISLDFIDQDEATYKLNPKTSTLFANLSQVDEEAGRSLFFSEHHELDDPTPEGNDQGSSTLEVPEIPQRTKLPREVQVHRLEVQFPKFENPWTLWVTSRPDLKTFLEALVSLPNTTCHHQTTDDQQPKGPLLPAVHLHIFTANGPELGEALTDFIGDVTGIRPGNVHTVARPTVTDRDAAPGRWLGNWDSRCHPKNFSELLPGSMLVAVELPPPLTLEEDKESTEAHDIQKSIEEVSQEEAVNRKQQCTTFYLNAVLLDDRPGTFVGTPVANNGLLARPFDDRYLTGVSGMISEDLDAFLLGEALPLISQQYSAYCETTAAGSFGGKGGAEPMGAETGKEYKTAASVSATQVWRGMMDHNERVSQEEQLFAEGMKFGYAY